VGDPSQPYDGKTPTSEVCAGTVDSPTGAYWDGYGSAQGSANFQSFLGPMFNISGPGNCNYNNWICGAVATGNVGGWSTPPTDGQNTTPVENAPRHSGSGANYLAVDGHVKFLMPQQASSGLGVGNPNQDSGCKNVQPNMYDSGHYCAQDATNLGPFEMTFSQY